MAAFADTTVLRYIFGVEPDLLFSKSSGTVAAPAPAAQSTLSEPLKPPAAMPPPPAAGDPVPVRAASTEEEEEVKPPILGFPYGFASGDRVGSNPEDSHVATPYYRAHFADRWFLDGLTVAGGPDLLDADVIGFLWQPLGTFVVFSRETDHDGIELASTGDVAAVAAVAGEDASATAESDDA